MAGDPFGENSSSQNSFLGSPTHNSGIFPADLTSSSSAASIDSDHRIFMCSVPDTPETAHHDGDEDYKTPPEVAAASMSEDAVTAPRNPVVYDSPPEVRLGENPNDIKRVVEEIRESLAAKKKSKGSESLGFPKSKSSESLGFPKSTPEAENTVELSGDGDEGEIEGDTKVMNEDIAEKKDEKGKSKLEFTPNSKEMAADSTNEDIAEEEKGKSKLEFSSNSNENGADPMNEDISEKEEEKGKSKLEFRLNSNENGADLMNEDEDIAEKEEEKGKSKLEFSSNSNDNGADPMNEDIDEGKGKSSKKKDKRKSNMEFSSNLNEKGVDSKKNKAKSNDESYSKPKENRPDSVKVLMLALELLVGRNQEGAEDDDEPVDIIETAKKKGMTFPRNRYLA